MPLNYSTMSTSQDVSGLSYLCWDMVTGLLSREECHTVGLILVSILGVFGVKILPCSHKLWWMKVHLFNLMHKFYPWHHEQFGHGPMVFVNIKDGKGETQMQIFKVNLIKTSFLIYDRGCLHLRELWEISIRGEKDKIFLRLRIGCIQMGEFDD